MHVQVADFVARQAGQLGAVRVLEIGSLDVNGGIRSYFPGATRYHGIDIADGPGVDEVADAAGWSTDERFDVVVSTEVLEHAPHWRQVLATGWDSLMAGGVLLMTCATEPRPPHSAIDGWDVREGEWYQNVAIDEILHLVRSWGARTWQVQIGRDRGDLYLRVDKPADRDPLNR